MSKIKIIRNINSMYYHTNDDYPNDINSIRNMTKDDEDSFCNYYATFLSNIENSTKKKDKNAILKNVDNMVTYLKYEQIEFLKRILAMDSRSNILNNYNNLNIWYLRFLKYKQATNIDIPFVIYTKIADYYFYARVYYHNDLKIRFELKYKINIIRDSCADYDFNKVNDIDAILDDYIVNYFTGYKERETMISLYAIDISEYMPSNLSNDQLNILGDLSIKYSYYNLFSKCLQLGYIPSNDKVKSLLNYNKYFICFQNHLDNKLYEGHNRCSMEFELLLKYAILVTNVELNVNDIKSNFYSFCKLDFLDIVINNLNSFNEIDMLSLYKRNIFPRLVSSTGIYDFSMNYDKYYHYIYRSYLSTRISIKRINKIFNNNKQIEFREMFKDKTYKDIKLFINRYTNVIIDQFCIENMIQSDNNKLYNWLKNKNIIMPTSYCISASQYSNTRKKRYGSLKRCITPIIGPFRDIFYK